MFKTLIALLIAFKEVLVDIQGCLKLNPNTPSVCLLCDSMMNYVIVEGTCVQNNIQNCLMTFSSGWCRLCNYGYFLDGSFQCAVVEYKQFTEIQNCNSYLTINECLVCNLNTYLVNGMCRPISGGRIPGCTVNQNANKCAICNLMLPTNDGKACQPVPSTGFANCMFFRHPVICTSCKPGYIPNNNYMITNINSPKMYTAFVFQLKFWKDSYFSLILNTPLCTPSYTINNCEELGYENTCTKCALGYTLNPNKTACFVQPAPPADPMFRIPNCYKFATQNFEICEICYEGYMLNPFATGCILITPTVPNCLIHSQTVKSTCVYCDNTYYLDVSVANPLASCILRNNYPVNCGTFDRVSDACTTCLPGTIFHFSNTKCSPLIENCNKYDISDRVLKCVLCKDGYYLDSLNVVCINANDATQGCLTYTYGGTCQVCLQGYYLDPPTFKCFPQDAIAGCDVRSVTVRALCDKCQNQAVNTAVVNSCKQLSTLNLVSNCLQYDSNSNCVICATGYLIYQGTGVAPSCIQVTGCIALANVNIRACGTCSGLPYFLWNGNCLKSDTRNCVYSLQSNATSSAFQMTTGYPCQICNLGYYYIVNPGVRTQVCNAILLGKNCLTYYAATNSLTSLVCNRCYRNYTLSRTLGQADRSCYPSDILVSANSTTYVSDSSPTNLFRSFYMASMSFDLLNNIYHYNIQPQKISAMFLWQTFSSVTLPLTGSTLNQYASPTTYCYQFDQTLSRCLSCKYYFPPVYVASTWANFLNSANYYQHNRWLYSYFSSSKDFDEIWYSTSSYPISGCRAKMTDNPITDASMIAAADDTEIHPISRTVGQSMITYYIGLETYHVCQYSADLRVWTVDNAALTMSVDMTSVSSVQANWPKGWGEYVTRSFFTGLSVPASYQSRFNATCTKAGRNNETSLTAVPSNCVLLQNNTDLQTTFVQRLFLSCAQCAPTYTLVTAWYQATISYSDGVGVTKGSNKFAWIITNCIQIPSTQDFLGFMEIQNCYSYNRSIPGRRPYYTCQDCKPGAIPTYGLQPFQCNIGDRWANPTRPDNCIVGALCTNFLVCQHQCGGLCALSACNQTTGACYTNVCNQCPSASNIQCQNPTGNLPCQNDWFCNYGTCQPICSCLNGESCNTKTNYVCTPFMSGVYSTFDLTERIEDIITANSIALGNSTRPNSCGCLSGHLCEGGVCYKLNQCPICRYDQYCLGTMTTVGGTTVYSYACASHPTCLTCTGTQYCQATFDYVTGASTVTGCGESPQLTFPYTRLTCPSCLFCWSCNPDEQCVNGICIRILKNVCGFDHSNTVPIYCGSTKKCHLGRCVDYIITSGGNLVYDCQCTANQICINDVCYTLDQCPICPQNKYCSPTKSGGSYVYSCVTSSFCINQCFGTNYCHSSYNYTTGKLAFDACRPYPQLSFWDPYAECIASNCAACNPPCGAEEQCVKTKCIVNSYNVCTYVFSGTVPVICKPSQTCYNGNCLHVSQTITDMDLATCAGQNKVWIKRTCYTLTHCPICPRNSYCKGTLSGGSYSFACVSQSTYNCIETNFVQASFNWGNGESAVTGCGPSPQLSFPYTAVTCPTCTLCSSPCDSISMCVSGVCIPNLTGVCSFKNNIIPVFCGPTQVCINDVCLNTIRLGSSLLVNCNAVPGSSICINNQTLALNMCPVCPSNQYCKGTLESNGVYTYSCATSLDCASCTGYNKWCASSFDFQTGVTTVSATCAQSPQFGFPYTEVSCPSPKCTLCTPSCPSTSTCANGVCIPILKNVCGWAFQNTVPIICAAYETCSNGICFQAKSYSAVITITCTSNQIFYNDVCYTLNQCPICDYGKYCKQTYISSVSNEYAYTCTTDSLCNTCASGTYCWGSYDFHPTTGSSTSAAIGCYPYPQLEMIPSRVVPVWVECAPSCGIGFSCANGNCVPNLINVCYYALNNIAVICSNTQTCINSQCIDSILYGSRRISDPQCAYGQVYLNSACYSLTKCPVCPHNQYCSGTRLSPSTETFGCSPDPLCSLCQTSTSLKYCSGTYTYSSGVMSNVGTCLNSPTWDFSTTTACIPACASGFTCVAGTCVPNAPVETCGFAFYNTVPFSCASGEFCFDNMCYTTDISLGCWGAGQYQICVLDANGGAPTTYTLTQCPVCPKHKYCQGILTSGNEFSYRCVHDAACDACTDTQFCQGNFDYTNAGSVNIVNPCGNSPQFTFAPPAVGNVSKLKKCNSNSPATTYPPGVGDTMICVNGTNIPILTNVCYFAFNGTIPITCYGTQICQNDQCIDNYPNLVPLYPITRYKVPGATQYTQTGMCPICPPNNFCKGQLNLVTLVYTFSCAPDPKCNACAAANQYCQGTFDFVTGISDIASPVCASTPQFGYTNPYCVACSACWPPCGSKEFCINTVCVSSPIGAAGCPLGCTHNTYCKGVFNKQSLQITFSCVADPACTCLLGQFCQGTLDFATGNTAVAAVACANTKQANYGINNCAYCANCDIPSACTACSTCTPSCTATEFCINSVCVPSPYGCSGGCTASSYCHATYVASPKSVNFACDFDPSCICPAGQFRQATMNILTGTSVIAATPCSNTEQTDLGSLTCLDYNKFLANANCPRCILCSPICGASEMCINRKCVASPYGCSAGCGAATFCASELDVAANTYRFFCKADPACTCPSGQYRQATFDLTTGTSAVAATPCGETPQINFGTDSCDGFNKFQSNPSCLSSGGNPSACSACNPPCSDTEMCLNGKCATSPYGCPTGCDEQSWCKSEVQGNKIVFSCFQDVGCTCSQGMFCQATWDEATGTSSLNIADNCNADRQTKFGEKNCRHCSLCPNSVCTQCQTCTSPCAAGEMCIAGLCFASPYGCNKNCGPSEYCKAVLDSANKSINYICKEDPSCACTGGRFLQSTIDLETAETRISTNSRCGPIQTTFDSLNCLDCGICVGNIVCQACEQCSPRCASDKICIKGVCHTSPYGCTDSCQNTKFCEATYISSPPSIRFDCGVDPACICPANNYRQALFNIATATSVVNTPPCSSEPQYHFGRQSCYGCSPPIVPCTAQQTCVNGVCMDNFPTNACGWDNNNRTIICGSNQLCVNQVCRNTYQLADTKVVDCGCNIGSICINGACYRLNECPVCEPQEVCNVIFSNNIYIYSCARKAECNNCGSGTWCHSDYDYNSKILIVMGCRVGPQLDFSNRCPGCSTCSGCTSPNVCVGGVCMPPLSKVCGWMFFNTVPVICTATQYCYKGACYNAPVHTSVCTANQLQVDNNCYNLNQCPICPRTQYCKATNLNGVVTYSCASDNSVCAPCTNGTNFCQASFSYKNSTSSQATSCGASPQFTFPWTYPNINSLVLPTCSPICSSSQQCVNGLCLDNIVNTCDTYKPSGLGTAFIYCKSTDVCINRSCRNSIPWASQKIASSACQLGNYYFGERCTANLNCPVCHNTDYCGASGSTAPYTFSCVSGNSICATCGNTNYCTSTVTNGATSTTFPVVTVNAANACQPNPHFAFPKWVINTSSVPGINPASCVLANTYIGATAGLTLLDNTVGGTSNVCVPSISNVCGFTFGLTVPVICKTNQYCVNSYCYDKYGPYPVGPSGCPIGSLLYDGVCYPLQHCPPCSQNQICTATYSAITSSYSFTCVTSATCTCSGTQYCQSTYSWQTSSSTATTGVCSNSPQWTFPATVNCPATVCATCSACSTGQCVNGVCVPNLSNVCYFDVNNTVPIVCPSGTTCLKSVCMPTLQMGLITVTDCGCVAGQICYQGNCLTSTYTVSCPKDQLSFLSATNNVCTTMPVCTTNNACSGCKTNQICQGLLAATGLTTSIQAGAIRCVDQFIASLKPDSGTSFTSCTAKNTCNGVACLDPKICFNNTICLDTSIAANGLKPSSVCSYQFRGSVPVICQANQVCVNGGCYSSNSLPVIYNLCGCPVGSICTRGNCYAIQCPSCSQNQYCVGQLTGSGVNIVYTFSCAASTKCQCSNTDYCWSAFGYTTGTTTETGTCKPYPQLGFECTGADCPAGMACSPSCGTGSTCIKGSCVPNLLGVCSYTLDGTVPVYCGLNDYCLNGVCVKPCMPDCPFGQYCEIAPVRTCKDLPTYNKNTIITGCTNVNNCGVATNYSRALNTCSRCADMYAFEAISTTTINGVPQISSTNTNKCVSVPTAQCYNAIITNTDAANPAGFCVSCIPGYTIDNNFCFPTISDCSFVNDAGYCLGCTYQYGSEAQNVTDGIFETGSCRQVDSTKYNVFTPHSGAFDANCGYFSLYYPSTFVAPVQFSTGRNVCVQCKSGFFLTAQFICLPASITSCVTYDVQNSLPGTILCQSCELGTTLSNDKMSCTNNVPPNNSPTPNCLLYFTSQSCAVCGPQTSMTLVGKNKFNQNTYCFSNSTTDPYCTKTDPIYFSQQQKISCAQCANINGNIAFPFTLPTFNYLCLDIAKVPNCLYHDATLLTNTMACLQCIDGYYFDKITNACVKRSASMYPITDCIVYAIFEDKCAQFFQAPTATVTVKAPLPLSIQILINRPPIHPVSEISVEFGGWIMGCEIYSNSNTCYQCYPPKYLDPFSFDYNTKCKTVYLIIPYCAAYSSFDQSCTKCQKFYMLTTGTCTLITAVGCLTYASPNQCATCPDTSPRLVNGNCEIDYSNPWCYQYLPTQTLDVYQCETCMEGFYANDYGICAQVHNPIQNCQYYQYDGLCKSCFKGFYLQDDGKMCLMNPSWDANCQTFAYGTECSVCQFGYVIINGVCTKCGTGSECAFCDPIKLGSCLFCNFGYYMTASGACVVNPLFVNGTTFFRNFQWPSPKTQTTTSSQSVSSLQKADLIPNNSSFFNSSMVLTFFMLLVFLSTEF